MDTSTFYEQSEKKSFFQSVGAHFIDLIQTLVVFGAIFALIYLFVAQPHKVSGNSMFPFLLSGDYILTEKISYRTREPHRGEVIVFRNPRDDSQDFVKRIIGLPGEKIKIERGVVYINDTELPETYLPKELLTITHNFLNEGEEYTITDNSYFVIGDNRNNSSDSREWGSVTSEKIIGRAIFRYWPLNSLGTL